MSIHKVERKSYLSEKTRTFSVCLEKNFPINIRNLEVCGIEMISLNFIDALLSGRRQDFPGVYQVLCSEVVNACPPAIFMISCSNSSIPLQAVLQLLRENRLPKDRITTVFINPTGEELNRLDCWWNKRFSIWSFNLLPFAYSAIPVGTYCLEPVPAEMSC